ADVARITVVLELARGRLGLEAGRPAALEPRELVARDRAALDALQRVRVVGEPGLQLRVGVEQERERGERQDDAEGATDRLRVRPDASGRSLPEGGDREHRERR